MVCVYGLDQSNCESLPVFKLREMGVYTGDLSAPPRLKVIIKNSIPEVSEQSYQSYFYVSLVSPSALCSIIEGEMYFSAVGFWLIVMSVNDVTVVCVSGFTLTIPESLIGSEDQ